MKSFIAAFINIGLLGLLVFIFSTPIASCKKDTFSASGRLGFSNDTLTFDTLFTTLGSTTKFFTIRNTSKQSLRISNIQLGGGGSSSYRINVDGDSGTSFSNVEIPAKDSIYVFVEVTVDPNSLNLPFIILDSIQFTTNGIQQQVILQAYGQNAHFFNADSIETNTVWGNDLPYVILNYVQIKQGVSLTINAGCNVYFGGGAAMIVEGDLQIKGTDTANMVTFRGVRLDKDIADRSYDDFPGQYAGVFFLRNSTGTIEYLKMRNSSYGINVGNIKTADNPADNILQLQLMSLSNAPVVNIRNSKIYNSAFYGLFGFQGKIYAENVLVYSCGKNVVGLYDGGDYQFTNCTFYTRGNTYITHTKDPLFYINNYFEYDATQPAILADSSRVAFINCIVYGSLDDEIIAEEAADNMHKIDLSFSNCVVKTIAQLTPPVFISCLGQDPQFEDVFNNKYKLKPSSPASNLGVYTGLTYDIDGFARSNPPDVGAYEIQ
jgi:hypothetical protein